MVYTPEQKKRIGYIMFFEDDIENIWYKIKKWCKYFFNKIEVENAGNNKIFKIPVQIYNKMSIRKIRTIINKINIEIAKNEIDGIVLCNRTKQILKKYSEYEKINEILYAPILDGKYLMKNVTVQIIEKILEYQNSSISQAKVHILVDNYNKENCDIIYGLSINVKNINIVTNNIQSYKKMEDKLFENTGTAISVANNRKKGLKRAEIIINLDFDNNLIKKYSINRNAIIINCFNESLEMNSGFSGVIINKVEYEEAPEMMEYFNIYKLNKNFEIPELFESLIFYKTYDKIHKQNSEYTFRITNFIGNRGKINKSEIKQAYIENLKNYTNNLTKI